MSNDDPNDNRPIETIYAVWQSYKRWDNSSVLYKNDQDWARKWALSLSVLAGVLSSLPIFIEESRLIDVIVSITKQYNIYWVFRDIIDVPHVLSAVSSVLVAMAGYIGRELLTPDKETIWMRCRMLAESLHRQVWYALMQVAPYHAEKSICTKKIQEEISKLERGAELSQVSQREEVLHIDPLPNVRGVEDYIQQRVRQQITWYRDKATCHQESITVWRRISLWLGLMAVCFSQIKSSTALVPVITNISAAFLAWVQSSHLQNLPSLYQQTAEQLELVLAIWRDGGYCGEQTQFVKDCEEIMAHENESWRVEWFGRMQELHEKNQKNSKKSD